MSTVIDPLPAAPSGVPRHESDEASSEWWRDAVVYQIYPRSFADSDGDGVGDLTGIRSRLEYLAALGVDAIWISPFYTSPQADGGYDVADFRAIDPLFGDLADADALIDHAHALELRVIVDLVPNHSSDQHEWFLRALREGPGSALRDRYHFRAGRGVNGERPPNDWESIFGGPAWTRTTNPDGSMGDWYLHLFAPEQPDFNWANRAVQEEFRSILRFWLDRGVDGFRIDVAHGLVKPEGLPDIGRTDQVTLLGTEPLPFFDLDGVHEVYRDWRRILDEYAGSRIGVAEAWTPTIERAARYVRPDELHQAFNFDYLMTAWDATRLRTAIEATLDAMRAVDAASTWVLSNHDVVRHRTRLGGGLDRARAATLLMLALPGSAYLYQGEELGLPEVVDLPDDMRQDPAFTRRVAGAEGQDGLRDGCRVPIPWTATGSSYGFGAGESWLPQPPDWGTLSVERQTGDPDSTLEFYRRALAIRQENSALGAGDGVAWVDAPDGVVAFRRDGADGAAVTCIVNTTDDVVVLPSELVDGGTALITSRPGGLSGGRMLAPDTAVWLDG